MGSLQAGKKLKTRGAVRSYFQHYLVTNKRWRKRENGPVIHKKGKGEEKRSGFSLTALKRKLMQLDKAEEVEKARENGEKATKMLMKRRCKGLALSCLDSQLKLQETGWGKRSFIRCRSL